MACVDEYASSQFELMESRSVARMSRPVRIAVRAIHHLEQRRRGELTGVLLVIGDGQKLSVGHHDRFSPRLDGSTSAPGGAWTRPATHDATPTAVTIAFE